MPYRDFRGSAADVTDWSDAQINRAIRSGRLQYLQEDPTEAPQTTSPKTTRKKTTRKTSAKKTTKK